MQSNAPKQIKQHGFRQSGLQFKTTKKRTNRRPVRSKSSISSVPDNKQNNQDIANYGQNKRGDMGYQHEGRNLNEFDFGKNKSKANYTEDQYVTRMVGRAYQYQSKVPLQRGENLQDKISIIQGQDIPIGEASSNNSISVWGQPENNQIQFRYTAHELTKLSRNCLRSNTSTSNHIRNRTETYNQITSTTPTQEKQKNFWSSRKNRNLDATPSFNQELNELSQAFQPKISNFQLGLCSNQDIFGKLYPARHLPTGFIVCIKVINKREVQHDLDRLVQWLKIQSYQNKQYITDIYGIFQEKGNIYVVMEYHAQGMLFLKMKSQIKMTPKDYLAYFYNICSAVKDLHSADIVYRNLKPENVSFFHDTCKISSMCWSSRVKSQKSNYSGTIEYCSPQLLLGSKYNKQSDIWGLGVLLYELAVGVAPCQNMSRRQARNKILNVQFEINSIVNIEVGRILDKIFIKDPNSRVTIDQLIQWIQEKEKQLQS